MSHLTLGVAGHIDHGKTSLVRALTGVETDRLKEERERGMSIVLGFAPLTLPGGSVIDFIDVPGHERFVGAMIAGASGIDALLLVIDAGEGVMPQTAEHLALAELLGVRRGLIAVTKVDLLGSSEQARTESKTVLRAALAETAFRDAPLVFTSTVTGEGLGALRFEIQHLLPEHEIKALDPAAELPFALPIDRVFVLPGHGTVVTGTLHGGSIRSGDAVEIVPSGLRTEARALQVHGAAVSSAAPGWRVAVNLRGVKKEQVRPGELLTRPGALRSTRMIDASLTLLPGAILKRGDQVRLHFNTTEVVARAFPLGQAPLLILGGAGGGPTQYSVSLNRTSPNPSLERRGEEDQLYVQFRLTAPAAAPAETPYVIRALSPAATLGGGRLLDLHPIRKSKLDRDSEALLDALAGDAPAAKLALKLKESGAQGCSLPVLAADLGLPLPQTPGPEIVLVARSLAVYRDALAQVGQLLLRALEAFHQENPRIEQGAPLAALRRRLPPGYARAEVVETAIDDLAARGEIAVGSVGLARAAGFVPQPLTPDEARTLNILENTYRRAKLQPPDEAALIKSDPVRREMLRLLARSGQLTAVPDRAAGRTLLFHPAALADLERHLASSELASSGFTVSEFTQAFQTTRKFAIPLLEYFDAQGKTRRQGDVRTWQFPPK